MIHQKKEPFETKDLIFVIIKGNTMNIQARKLSLIEEFLKISDESIIEKLESIIKIEHKRQQDRVLKPLSTTEFYGMIDQAKEDKKAGNVISHSDLKAKSKSWR